MPSSHTPSDTEPAMSTKHSADKPISSRIAAIISARVRPSMPTVTPTNAANRPKIMADVLHQHDQRKSQHALHHQIDDRLWPLHRPRGD